MSAPQAYVILNDSAIVWESVNYEGGVSLERYYPGWELHSSPWDAVFVWNNASLPSAGGSSRPTNVYRGGKKRSPIYGNFGTS